MLLLLSGKTAPDRTRIPLVCFFLAPSVTHSGQSSTVLMKVIHIFIISPGEPFPRLRYRVWAFRGCSSRSPSNGEPAFRGRDARTHARRI
uniref:Putative secreted protein n=1 Tax=Anopheles darlingi TaxID=43151 RepID=A0A2M4DLK0_ANODA